VDDARHLIPTIQALLSAARGAGFPVFFTREGMEQRTKRLSPAGKLTVL
jgi:nicotinamidase-related amidase